MNGLVAAVTLLTRVPIPGARHASGADATGWLPVVGAAIGLLAGIAYMSLAMVLPVLAAAGITVAMTALLTGALHEDGLADAADALGARTKQQSLDILADPHHGTYGVLALVLSVVIRIAALAAISPALALAVMPVVHSASRATTVVLVATTPPARDHGLAASVHATFVRRSALVAVAVSGVLALWLVGGWLIAVAAVVTGVAWIVRRKAMCQIGGVTGDVLGAAQQLTEIALLIVFATVLAPSAI